LSLLLALQGAPAPEFAARAASGGVATVTLGVRRAFRGAGMAGSATAITAAVRRSFTGTGCGASSAAVPGSVRRSFSGAASAGSVGALTLSVRRSLLGAGANAASASVLFTAVPAFTPVQLGGIGMSVSVGTVQITVIRMRPSFWTLEDVAYLRRSQTWR
jgi:hypothetical protein